MNLYRNKYRIESARWRNWDYADAGAYFITICTANREHYFGEISALAGLGTPTGMAQIIETPDMASLRTGLATGIVLSDIGRIVESEWLKTPEIRPDMNLMLGEFVVMPNHFHAIIAIGENEYNGNRSPVETPCMASPLPQQLPSQLHDTKKQPGPQRKNLSSIVRGFKSAVTVLARAIEPDFAWQSRFHDRIIRSRDEYGRIEDYILNNPENWQNDKFYNM
ncbi:MAG: hypothetical protein BGN96_08415 [Bacteroidales bacterium 45-6]|nr:MAG: hypothetical protein BGN96_08415 [Bacteroidales bacterium 45-6]